LTLSNVHGQIPLASGTATIDRRDFGMSFGPLIDGALIAGCDVTITRETDAIEN
jgi:polyisoprenoid-binding protein YceI